MSFQKIGNQQRLFNATIIHAKETLTSFGNALASSGKWRNLSECITELVTAQEREKKLKGKEIIEEITIY